MVLVSIIVPVYNATQNLNKCINSLIYQTYNKLEIILIDDGSTDNSFEIMMKKSSEDSRIKVFSRKNQGVSATRNFGLQQCNGQYIMFVDSDDYIEKNSVELLINEAVNRNLDILVFNYIQVQGDRYVINDIEEKEYSCKDFLMEYLVLKNPIYCRPPWNRLYKANIIRDLRFDIELSLAEDFIFNVEAILNAERIAITNLKTYYYLVTDSGLCNKRRKENFYLINELYIAQRLYELVNSLFKENSENCILDDFILGGIFSSLQVTLYHYHNIDVIKSVLENSINKEYENFIKMLKVRKFKWRVVKWLLIHRQYSLIYLVVEISRLRI